VAVDRSLSTYLSTLKFLCNLFCWRGCGAGGFFALSGGVISGIGLTVGYLIVAAGGFKGGDSGGSSGFVRSSMIWSSSIGSNGVFGRSYGTTCGTISGFLFVMSLGGVFRGSFCGTLTPSKITLFFGFIVTFFAFRGFHSCGS
jgi:hypothetical protein